MCLAHVTGCRQLTLIFLPFVYFYVLVYLSWEKKQIKFDHLSRLRCLRCFQGSGGGQHFFECFFYCCLKTLFRKLHHATIIVIDIGMCIWMQFFKKSLDLCVLLYLYFILNSFFPVGFCIFYLASVLLSVIVFSSNCENTCQSTCSIWLR